LTQRDGACPEVVAGREDLCFGCQHCFAICPSGSLSIFGLDPAGSEIRDPAGFPSPEAMGRLIRNRRSVRKYERENVPAEVIDGILADLQYVPTAQNKRYLKFTVVDDYRVMDGLRERIVSLAEKALAGGLDSRFVAGVVKYMRRDGVDVLFRGAPHLMLVSAHEGQVSAAQDVSLALAYFELLAASRGLGTCWCGFLGVFERAVPGVREALGLGATDAFYSVYFGPPAVRYARAPQRLGTSAIARLA
jgi:nitroreductase